MLGFWSLTTYTIYTASSEGPPLLKRLTLLALTLCMNTLFYYDCLGHNELENIANDERGGFVEFVLRDGMGGTDHTP